MRGLVMVLMTLDHSSEAFNKGRLFTDAVFLPQPPLEAAQFLTRWVTHLCAPTFVFLAGTSLALSVSRRKGDGESIDGFIVKRGLFIAALDPLWMSWIFLDAPPTKQVLFQVLYAIGMSFVAMAALRRLPNAVIGGLGLALALGHEALAGVWSGTLASLLVRGGPIAIAGGAVTLICGYPLLPWLAIMMMGWAFGGYLQSGKDPRRALLVGGVVALAAFVVVRGTNGFGNDGLLRRDGSLLEWLHVSKYPPAIAYDGLELGIMALLLAAFFSIPAGSEPAVLRPLRLFGQTAFFYYLLHAHLLIGVAHATGAYHEHGLGLAYLATVVVAAALHPLCRAYLSLKRRHPQSVLRYV
jgi:uncharacterized membrane protein